MTRTEMQAMVGALTAEELEQLRQMIHQKEQLLLFTEEERQNWVRGSKIEAIKSLRQRKGLGLVEAKHLFEEKCY